MYLPRSCSIVVEYILSTHCIVGNALCMLAHYVLYTIDWEIFTLKIIRLKNFRGSFDPRNFFNGWRLQYEQEPDIAGYNVVAVRSSRQLGFYLRRCGHVCASLFVDHVSVFICMLNLHGWSQARNYFNSEIFPIYSSRKSSKVQNFAEMPPDT